MFRQLQSNTSSLNDRALVNLKRAADVAASQALLLQCQRSGGGSRFQRGGTGRGRSFGRSRGRYRGAHQDYYDYASNRPFPQRKPENAEESTDTHGS